MLIKQPPSSSPHVLNPQLHTHKNHHTYNGALYLPDSIHVQVIPHDHRTNTTTTATTAAAAATEVTEVTRIAADYRKRSKTKPDRRRYLITLHYAHNRACELRRSGDDVLVLREALGTGLCAVERVLAAAAVSWSGEGGSSRNGSSSNMRGGSDDAPVPAEQRIPCPRTCSCPCSCAVRGRDARSAMDVNGMLGEALEKVKKGDAMARVAVEWFLRRRIGDCGGGGTT